MVMRFSRGSRMALLGAAFGLIVTAVIATAGKSYAFGQASVSGRYTCSIISDGGGENSAVILIANGRGTFTGSKFLLLDGYYCYGDDDLATKTTSVPAGDGPSCSCKYTITPTANYLVAADGSATSSIVWVGDVANEDGCPVSFTDVWSFMIGNGGGALQVVTSNNGDQEAPGSGVCSRTLSP